MRIKKYIGIRRLFFFTPGAQLKEKYFINNGNYALISLRGGIITKEALEAARKAIKRVIKRTCLLRICAAAYLPITQKPSEVRMGKGKGKVKGYVSILRGGHVLFEIISPLKYSAQARLALVRAAVKLPMACKVIKLKDRLTNK